MSRFEFKKLINFIAFVAVILIGIALILVRVGVLGSVSGAFLTVANIIGYIITACAAFFYVRAYNQIWMWVLYTIGIVMIIVSYFI